MIRMDKKEQFISLAVLAVKCEAMKKIVFSRPLGSDIKKVSGRLCAHRGNIMLALEYSLPSGTVSQKNVTGDGIKAEIRSLLSEYLQVNLITSAGDAEWKISSSGKAALLGAEKLERKLLCERPAFESAIEALDRKKNYILEGNEEFLIQLGISDKSGRIHDKKQGKFRQINRFLEQIEKIYSSLPSEGELLIYDLCCGKSYLSFAVYYYLTEIKGREVKMLGIDLKRDVIDWCAALAKKLGFGKMTFVADDIKNTPKSIQPDMVISLHACDIATDIVLNTAAELRAKIILSTPCCHRYLNGKVQAPELKFITAHPHIAGKLCEAITDSLRILRLSAYGYSVTAAELTDPDDTPKNTLIRAILKSHQSEAELDAKKAEYDEALKFILGENFGQYSKEI